MVIILAVDLIINSELFIFMLYVSVSYLDNDILILDLSKVAVKGMLLNKVEIRFII